MEHATMSDHPPSSILVAPKHGGGGLHPRRILVRGVNWLGDAVMTTPALLRLREKFPDAHIALLTPEKLRDLWLHHPAVNETISFAPGENVFSIGKKLRVGNLISRSCCPIRRARRWKFFLREFRNASATRARGGIFF